MRLTAKIVHHKLSAEEISKSNASIILNTINKPNEGDCFLIDSLGEVIFGFVKNHEAIPNQKSMGAISETVHSLENKIDQGELVVKKFYKRNWKKIKALAKEETAAGAKIEEAYLTQKTQVKQKKFVNKPVDWVSTRV